VSVRWVSVFLDVPPELFEPAAAFWTEVTGTHTGRAVGSHDEFVPLEQQTGQASLWLQRLDDGPVSCHVDLYVEDVEAEVRRATDLGASRLRMLEDLGVVVLASPGGLPFCLVRHRDQSARMVPVGGDGRRSVLDQVCLDIPASRYDAECGFWERLTGWPLDDTDDHDEFRRLTRPTEIPYAFLLQRLDDPVGAVTAHLDLACQDRGAECERHLRLGATAVRRTDGWTVMRDPAGLTYCITRRRPGDV
jgi:Glyoxalase-like domain